MQIKLICFYYYFFFHIWTLQSLEPFFSYVSTEQKSPSLVFPFGCHSVVITESYKTLLKQFLRFPCCHFKIVFKLLKHFLGFRICNGFIFIVLSTIWIY